MFQGEYYHSLDSKNRLFIPARFREELGNEFYLTPSPEGCIFVFPEERWKFICDQQSQNDSTVADRNKIRRALWGVTSVTPDKQGRVTLTPRLIQYADLQKEVLIFGMTTRVEIWNLDRFNNAISSNPKPIEGLIDESLFPYVNF